MPSQIVTLDRILDVARNMHEYMDCHMETARQQNLHLYYRLKDGKVYIRDLETFEGGDFNLMDFLLASNPREFFETNF